MIRDHYFECLPDGNLIYIGGTLPSKTSRDEQLKMFFDKGITNSIVVIQGSMSNYDPPKPPAIDENNTSICDYCGSTYYTFANCPNCGHH